MSERNEKSRRVLVCDDDEIFQQTVTLNLQYHGFHVVGNARNGFESINLFEEEKPDIVLLDINMPKGGGLTVLRFIRELDKRAFVIMLTNDSSLETVKTAVRLGANNYRLKSDFQKGDFKKEFFDALKIPKLFQAPDGKKIEKVISEFPFGEADRIKKDVPEINEDELQEAIRDLSQDEEKQEQNLSDEHLDDKKKVIRMARSLDHRRDR